jgi:hypothetical protein
MRRNPNHWGRGYFVKYFVALVFILAAVAGWLSQENQEHLDEYASEEQESATAKAKENASGPQSQTFRHPSNNGQPAPAQQIVNTAPPPPNENGDPNNGEILEIESEPVDAYAAYEGLVGDESAVPEEDNNREPASEQ